ncbi:RE1-silencing transcription factor-like [Cylas formicarius]|uniref:RE1-silencing transcription factor-like n=1 Tax=Cylas formicarius TaxID=197179 RepID=UPI00295860B0|nr:RE1-silencing transcription factor-like [Cylas formicarius]
MKTRKEEDSPENEEDGEEVEPFECKYCDFETDDIDILDAHIFGHENEEDDESKVAKYTISPGRKRKANQDYSIVSPSQVQTGSGAKKTKIMNQLDDEDSTLQNDDEGPESFIYVCPYCTYQSERKKGITKHISLHETPIEVMIYKCSECPYQTKRKCDMPKHLLTHCTNAPMFECPICDYKTKRKNDLPKHVLCHKKPGEATTYKCDHCPYTSKRKGDLNKHIAVHKNYATGRFEDRIFNCTECGYTSKRLNDLHKHTVLHCDREYSGIFKCKKCDYASDKPNKFARHVLSSCQIMEACISLDDCILVEEKEMPYYEQQVEGVTEQHVLEENEEEVSEIDSQRKVVVVTEYGEDSVETEQEN